MESKCRTGEQQTDRRTFKTLASSMAAHRRYKSRKCILPWALVHNIRVKQLDTVQLKSRFYRCLDSFPEDTNTFYADSDTDSDTTSETTTTTSNDSSSSKLFTLNSDMSVEQRIVTSPSDAVEYSDGPMTKSISSEREFVRPASIKLIFRINSTTKNYCFQDWSRIRRLRTQFPTHPIHCLLHPLAPF